MPDIRLDSISFSPSIYLQSSFALIRESDSPEVLGKPSQGLTVHEAQDWDWNWDSQMPQSHLYPKKTNNPSQVQLETKAEQTPEEGSVMPQALQQ